jgi:hypothetical protein
VTLAVSRVTQGGGSPRTLGALLLRGRLLRGRLLRGRLLRGRLLRGRLLRSRALCCAPGAPRFVLSPDPVKERVDRCCLLFFSLGALAPLFFCRCLGLLASSVRRHTLRRSRGRVRRLLASSIGRRKLRGSPERVWRGACTQACLELATAATGTGRVASGEGSGLGCLWYWGRWRHVVRQAPRMHAQRSVGPTPAAPRQRQRQPFRGQAHGAEHVPGA